MARLADLKTQPHTKAQLRAYVRTTLRPALAANYLKARLLGVDLNRWWASSQSIRGKEAAPGPDEPDESDYITPALEHRQHQAAENYFQKLGAYYEVPDESTEAKQLASKHLKNALDKLGAINADFSQRAQQYQAAMAEWEQATREPASMTVLTTDDSKGLARLKRRLQEMISKHNSELDYLEPRGETTRATFRAFPERFLPSRHYYRLARGGTWPMYFFEYDEVGLEAHLHYQAPRGKVEEVIIKLSGEAHGEHAVSARGIVEHLTSAYVFDWSGARVAVPRPPVALPDV